MYLFSIDAFNKIINESELPLAEIARLSSLTTNTIYRVGSGRNENPTVGTLLAICNTLNADPSKLFVKKQ